jgi:hypothetical protein
MNTFRASCFASAVLAVLFTWPLYASAQIRDTGAINVRVTGPGNTLLVGVLVTIEGPLGVRADHTGINGTARLPGLAPGSYIATFALEGFNEVVRKDLRISVGRTIEIVIAMQLASVQETITISGESPVVDIKSTNVLSIYTDDLIDMTPTSSGLWAGIIDHVPGVVTNLVDIGGSESGQQSRFSSRGGSSSQNVYALNGANTTDPQAVGASSMYYSINSFEEVGISTGAHDVEVQVPGVVLNMVSKTGSNDWHGAARIFFEGERFTTSNVTGEQRERGSGAGNPNVLLNDLDFQFGGPIKRNRAWFFVDYWNFKVERRLIGLPPHEVDDTTLENWTINGTVQIAENSNVTARLFTDRKVRNNRNAGGNIPPESAWLQDSLSLIPQVQYQGVVGSNLFLDTRFSFMTMNFPLEAKDGSRGHSRHPEFSGESMPPSIERSTGNVLAGSPPTREVLFLRDNIDLSSTLSWYLTERTRSHDLKVGGNLAKVSSFSPDNRGYIWGFQQQFLNGDPSRVRFWNHSGVDIHNIDRPNAPWNRGSSVGLYAQDSITFNNRLTVNLGLRYDWSKSWLPEQCRTDSLFPQLGALYRAACFEKNPETTSWRDFVPRIGIVYDLTGNGRTALKANYSRYSNQQGVRWGGFLNPNGVGTQLYTWADLNGDNFFQFGEQDTLIHQFFPGGNVDIDPELRSPLTDEFSIGVERELFPHFQLGATLFYRTDSNFLEDVNIGVPYGPIAEVLGVGDSYQPVTVTDPGPDGVVGTKDDGGPITIYSQDPATFGNSLYYLTNPIQTMGFDFLYNRYTGVSLVAHKRWSNNWQVLASWDIGRSEGTFDGGGAGGAGGLLDNPNTDINRAGLTVWDRTHLVKVTGNYLFADPVGVNLGIFMRVQSGEPMTRNAMLPASGVPSQPSINQGTEHVRVEQRGRHVNTYGVERLDPVMIVDLRAEKQFTLGKYGLLHAYADLFNVFNTNEVLAIDVYSGANYNNIWNIVSPRVLRIGAGFDFLNN